MWPQKQQISQECECAECSCAGVQPMRVLGWEPGLMLSVKFQGWLWHYPPSLFCWCVRTCRSFQHIKKEKKQPCHISKLVQRNKLPTFPSMVLFLILLVNTKKKERGKQLIPSQINLRKRCRQAVMRHLLTVTARGPLVATADQAISIHQCPPVATSISFLFCSAQQPLAFLHLKPLLWWKVLTVQSSSSARKKTIELFVKATVTVTHINVWNNGDRQQNKRS